MNVRITQTSSLKKIRAVSDFPELFDRYCVLSGNSFSYQIVLRSDAPFTFAKVKSVECELPTSLYRVDDAVMDFPTVTDDSDDDYLTKEPGIMPDILTPIDSLSGYYLNNSTIWVTAHVPEGTSAGEYPIKVIFEMREPLENATFEKSVTMTLEVLKIPALQQKTCFTQWFHTDCIASIHNVPVYSDKHWEYIEKYMLLAHELGINTILTPILTPYLDTGIGIRRPSTQLVKIEKNGNAYSFDFALVKKWVDLCKKCGFEYYEISHLFSQWGLKYPPHIVVCENGEEKFEFGVPVEVKDSKYKDFLAQFLPALLEFLKGEGILDNCLFHISDEPMLEHMENYKTAYDMVKEYLGDVKIMDAISNIEFYDAGFINTPVTASDHIEPFLAKNIDNLWTYYCCVQRKEVGNRFLSMPSYRNRILGLQMYKYGIKGFLQWGYNFYYSQYSMTTINPYSNTSALGAFPSGDAFSVYPTENGPIPSLRAVIFREALQDIETCRLLESYIGREKVIELIDSEAGMDITFKNYPRCDDFVPNLIEKMLKMIKELA